MCVFIMHGFPDNMVASHINNFLSETSYVKGEINWSILAFCVSLSV